MILLVEEKDRIIEYLGDRISEANGYLQSLKSLLDSLSIIYPKSEQAFLDLKTHINEIISILKIDLSEVK